MVTKSAKFLLLSLLFISCFVGLQPTITANAPTEEFFSVIQISDTQSISATTPTAYTNLTTWIVQQSANLNLKMVIHTGDIVNTPNSTAEWTVANNAMMTLYNNNIPYCWDAASHDELPLYATNAPWIGSSYSAFNVSNFKDKTYWVSDAVDGKNTATRFTVNGYAFLIINLEMVANSTGVAWMKNLLATYPNDNVIFATHDYLNSTQGYGMDPYHSWEPAMKTTLDGYPHIFMTISGHDPGYPQSAPYFANMTRVGNREELLFNQQAGYSAAGYGGYVAAARIYTFDIAASTCGVSTYVVNNGTWLTDQWNQFSFSLTNLNPEPTPSPSPSPNPANAVINSIYAMLPLLALVVVVTLGGLVLFGLQGSLDNEQILAGLLAVIFVGVGSAIIVLVLSNVETIVSSHYLELHSYFSDAFASSFVG